MEGKVTEKYQTCKNCGKKHHYKAETCPFCQYNEAGDIRASQAPDQQNKKNNINPLGMVAGAIAILVGVWIFTSGSTDPMDKNHSSMATVMCENVIEQQLKSPASAKHPVHSAKKISGQTYGMRSYVDSQNVFGVVLRTSYICQIKYTGGEPADVRNWTIQNLQILQ
jgi:ribosomal protein L37E